jgi:hypothetical protein
MWRNYGADPPGIDRERTTLSATELGDEVLWNTGPDHMAAPANSPAAFVVACRKYMWRAPQASCPINSGQADNDDSIALVIRFANFFFYTGGDLPSPGENLVRTAVMGYGFTDPQGGGTFPVPTRIAALKVGHHGSSHSTTTAFLAGIQPRAGFISCGVNTFGEEHHPAQATVDRLQIQQGLCFYLTNCNYETIYVPASQGIDQLTAMGNRSRICGDNATPNLGANRRRGDIMLYLNQAESTAVAGAPARQFHVRYWDNDGPAGAEVGIRTENHQF